VVLLQSLILLKVAGNTTDEVVLQPLGPKNLEITVVDPFLGHGFMSNLISPNQFVR